MTDQDILKRITPVFRRVFEDDGLVVTRELNASQVAKWDSLNHISLVLELESTLGCRFTTDELASMANVGDLVDLLKRKGLGGG